MPQGYIGMLRDLASGQLGLAVFLQALEGRFYDFRPAFLRRSEDAWLSFLAQWLRFLPSNDGAASACLTLRSRPAQAAYLCNPYQQFVCRRNTIDNSIGTYVQTA
ncbi:MAG: hypothetical protein WBA42_23245 [Mesorhizobium sp.]